MPRSARVPVCLFALLLVSACQMPRQPQSWLRYAPADPTGWTVDAAGLLHTDCGPANIAIDLHPSETRVAVVVVNGMSGPITVRTGALGVRPTDAVGDVERQPVSGGPSDDVPRIVPFLAHQDVEVRPGWRATFVFDNLLGRQPNLGQYAVLEMEVQAPGKPLDRRLLPLVATNVQSRGPGR